MRLRDTVRRLLGRGEEQRAITSVPWDVGGSVRSSVVSAEQALGLVPVFAAVRLLASQIASLPLQGYRKLGPPGGEIRTRIATPPLFVAPSVHGTLYDWLHRAVTSLALRGNAYGLIVTRNADQYPTTIEWLHPDDVWCNDLAASGPGSYANPIWYWQGRILPAEDLLHIAWFTTPGKVCGLSPIGACAATLSTGLSAQDYTSRWFDNGAVPPGKFRNTEKKINQVEAAEIGARLNAAIRTRKPLVYGNDWEYDPIAVAAHEAKFVETLKLNATQIAAIYGIPPEMIGGEAGGPLTYNTVEQNALNFVKFTLRPWLELLEEAFFPLIPRPQYVRFNIDALLRTDLQTRMASYQVARDIGLNNIDELRGLEDQPPLPNGQGRDYTPLKLMQQAGTAPALRTGLVFDVDGELPPDELVRSQNGHTRPVHNGQPLQGTSAVLMLEARRDDPSHPAAFGRKFNPSQPRIPEGEHGGEWVSTGGVAHALADALKGLDNALTGQDALDAAPSRLIPDPEWAYGGLDGAHFTGPSGHGSARALAEYQGLEYQQTNSVLRGKYGSRPRYPWTSDENWARQEAHRLEVEKEVAGRVAEIDKTMAVSHLTSDVKVHRVIKDGEQVFGLDVWYGDVVDINSDDFDKVDEQMEVWKSGVRPDLAGLEWSEDAYLSTSVDPAVVDHYTGNMRHSEPIVLNILVPKGTGAVQLSEIGNQQEAEILLQRGLRMRVIKDHGLETVTHRLGDVYQRRVLDVEVIPDAG